MCCNKRKSKHILYQAKVGYQFLKYISYLFFYVFSNWLSKESIQESKQP